jgi:NTE family protein
VASKASATSARCRPLQDARITTYPRIAGTSAGSIVGALAAAGISAEEVRTIMYALEYRKIRDRAGIDRLPIIDRGLSLLPEDGIYEGS